MRYGLKELIILILFSTASIIALLFLTTSFLTYYSSRQQCAFVSEKIRAAQAMLQADNPALIAATKRDIDNQILELSYALKTLEQRSIEEEVNTTRSRMELTIKNYRAEIKRINSLLEKEPESLQLTARETIKEAKDRLIEKQKRLNERIASIRIYHHRPEIAHELLAELRNEKSLLAAQEKKYATLLERSNENITMFYRNTLNERLLELKKAIKDNQQLLASPSGIKEKAQAAQERQMSAIQASLIAEQRKSQLKNQELIKVGKNSFEKQIVKSIRRLYQLQCTKALLN